MAATVDWFTDGTLVGCGFSLSGKAFGLGTARLFLGVGPETRAEEGTGLIGNVLFVSFFASVCFRGGVFCWLTGTRSGLEVVLTGLGGVLGGVRDLAEEGAWGDAVGGGFGLGDLDVGFGVEVGVVRCGAFGAIGERSLLRGGFLVGLGEAAFETSLGLSIPVNNHPN